MIAKKVRGKIFLIKKISFLFVTLTVLISSIVLAFDDAPPAIPSEYWGIIGDGSIADGLPVTAEVNDVNYAQTSVTQNGSYNVILINGDRELTYNDDRNCSIHWGNGQACIPCANELACIEGPQDGTLVTIKVNDTVGTPTATWQSGNIVEQGIILVEEGKINFSITLVPNWNLISIPIIPSNASIAKIMQGCSYNRVWEFENDQSWKNTVTGLTSMDIMHGYWVDRVSLAGNCTITIEGTAPTITNINVTSTWTLAGFPSTHSQSIIKGINSSLYDRIWKFEPDQSWINTATGLVDFTPGFGYWIDCTTGGSYNVTN